MAPKFRLQMDSGDGGDLDTDGRLSGERHTGKFFVILQIVR